MKILHNGVNIGLQDDKHAAELLGWKCRLRAVYDFACEAHKDQRRKHADEPFIVHPIRVAARTLAWHQTMGAFDRFEMYHVGTPPPQEDVEGLLGDVNSKYEVLNVMAALLHDVVEDTSCTIRDIRTITGSDIATQWVADLTEAKIQPRKARKELYLEQLSKAGEEVHLIKQMDILDNFPSIYEHDKGFWPKYREEKIAELNVLTRGCSMRNRVMLRWLDEHP